MRGWRQVRLGEVCEVLRGGSPRPIQKYITQQEDGLNWIKIGDVSPDGKYITHTAERIKPEGLSKTRWVDEGDFLLSNSMSFGRPYILKTSGCIHDGWLVLKKWQKVFDADFLYWLLRSPLAQTQFDVFAHGAAVRNLNTESVANIEIPIPPLAEQRSIVARVEKRMGRVERMEVGFQSMREWAGKRRQAVLAEAFDAEGKEDGEDGGRAARAPTGWSQVKLGEVCEIQRGKVMSIKYLKNHPGPYPVFSSQTKNEGVFGHIDTFDFEGEYLTWTTDGANAGSVFYRNGKFSITNVCGLIKPDSSLFDARCLCYYLQLVAKSHVNKSLGNPKLMSNVMARIPVPIPPLPVQHEIVAKLDEALEQGRRVEALAREGVEHCAHLRRAVLEEAFS